jgi:hypothetical protein
MAQRVEVVLGDEEREVLERWARRPKSAQALALRCRIVLAAADGEPSKETHQPPQQSHSRPIALRSDQTCETERGPRQ